MPETLPEVLPGDGDLSCLEEEPVGWYPRFRTGRSEPCSICSQCTGRSTCVYPMSRHWVPNAGLCSGLLNIVGSLEKTKKKN